MILPALFVAVDPDLNALNIMGLATPQSAILSAVIFNALVIVALIPLALRGAGFWAAPASAWFFCWNLSIDGLGGDRFAPFIGIKLIDLVVSRLHSHRTPIQTTTFLRHGSGRPFAILIVLTIITANLIRSS